MWYHKQHNEGVVAIGREVFCKGNKYHMASSKRGLIFYFFSEILCGLKNYKIKIKNSWFLVIL